MYEHQRIFIGEGEEMFVNNGADVEKLVHSRLGDLNFEAPKRTQPRPYVSYRLS